MMTDDEKIEIWERSHRLLDEVDQQRAEHERWRQERAQREAMQPAATPLPEPANRNQRPPERRIEGRNWDAEEDWIGRIIDKRLQTLGDAIGQVVAHERRQFHNELENLRTEVRTLLAEARAEQAREVLARLDRLLLISAELEAGNDKLAALPRRLPN